MIPHDVDMESLARQLSEDGVAIGAVGEEYPRMEGELHQVLEEASASGFGSTGMVLLDSTPEQAADQRDIAQDLLNAGELDTVIVRSPGSGAIVSDVHSRAEIESAQAHFLNNPDIVAATRSLVDHISAADVNWAGVTALLLAVVIIAAVLTWLSVRNKMSTPRS